MQEEALLLSSAIVTDTINLDPAQSRCLQLDKDMAEKCLRIAHAEQHDLFNRVKDGMCGIRWTLSLVGSAQLVWCERDMFHHEVTSRCVASISKRRC